MHLVVSSSCDRNLKKFHFRGKKDKAVVAEEPVVEEEIPVDSDPIMEDREDVSGAKDVQSEEIRGDDERSAHSDSEQPAHKVDSETTAATTTAAADEEKDDTPPTVNEESQKEETGDDDAAHPIGNVQKDVAQSMDEDLTLDATATYNEEGCHTPAHTPAFCGCFAA